ncbi:MAG: hypothetical protein IKJ32_01025 [Clostridia bacterium]|nr:hypothetical protein [Clostridia bacterium]
MKKILMLLLALVMCFSLAGCKGNDDVVEENKNNVEVTDSGESVNDSSVKYAFSEDTIEIDYAGQYTVVYHFENDLVTMCDMVYEFPSEEAAIAYETSGKFNETTIVKREGTVVTITNDYSAQNLTRTTVEEMAKTLAAQ